MPTSTFHDPNFLTTPFDKVVQLTPKGQGVHKPLLVLLAVGSFSEIHRGYIEMMEEVKDEKEREGFQVVGGYLAPAFQSYEDDSIEQVLFDLEMLVHQSNWLYVDPWAVRFASQSHDASQIAIRLKAYLNHHIQTEQPIEIGIVSDRKIRVIPFVFEAEEQSVESIYAIRNDLPKAFAMPTIHTEQAVMGLKEAFSNAFDPNMTLQVIEVGDQEEKAKQIVEQKGLPTVSMDVFVRGEFNLDISRLFEMGTLQYRSKQLVNRPNTPPLEEQVEAIVPGHYLLIEDDMPTGLNTMKRVKELFEGRVIIDDMLILSHLDEGQRDTKFFDIVDMRDFIFGAKHGGLVVSLPNGEHVRVPYVLPYASPISRASVPVGKAMAFSKSVLELNRRFYEHNPMVLSQMDASFVKFMRYIGFRDDDSMVHIINWHQEKLNAVAR